MLLRWNSTGITIAGISGVSGNTNMTLNKPYDIAIDWARTLYIADRDNHRVQKYLKDASVGKTICGQANGVAGATSGHLRYPPRLIVDTDSNVYVVDRSNYRVQYWSNGATTGSTIAGITGYYLIEKNDKIHEKKLFFLISRCCWKWKQSIEWTIWYCKRFKNWYNLYR